MTQYIFANQYNATLTASVAPSDTSISVSTASALPVISSGQYIPLILNDAATGAIYEVMYVSAISGTTLTVIRGQEGSTAQSWASGDYVFSDNTQATTANSYGDPTKSFSVADAAEGTQEAPSISQSDLRYIFSDADGSGNNVVKISSATTLTQSQSGKIIYLSASTGPYDLTLPASPVAGTKYKIYGTGSNIVTLKTGVTTGSPSLNFPDDSIAYQYAIPGSSSQGIDVVFDGSNWQCQTFGETIIAPASTNGQAVNRGQFSSSFNGTSSAWTKTPDATTPSGYRIEQWVKGPVHSGGSGQFDFYVSWPIAFPNACSVAVCATHIDAVNNGGDPYYQIIGDAGITSAHVYRQIPGSGTDTAATWVTLHAIGY